MLTPPAENVLPSLIPDRCRAHFAVKGITVPTHPDLARLLGYLPDTHSDGWLSPGKLHPVCSELGLPRASPQLW